MSFCNVYKSIVLFSIFNSYYLLAQHISVETRIDTNRLTIGDQTTLTYHLKRDNKIPVDLPVGLTNVGKGIETVGAAIIDSTSTGDVILKYTVTSFDTGMYYLPPLPFVAHHHGISDTIFSTSTYLEVFGVPIDTTGTIRDIKANAKVPLSFGEIMLYLLFLAIYWVICWYLIKYFRKEKIKEEHISIVKQAEPVYITALRELDKIKAQKLWQQKQVKEYYVRITHTIRWYIAKRFNIPALEETSDEIMNQLEFLKLDHENYQILSNLLDLADLVKFAKGEPNPDENIIHLDNAYDFIKKTKDSTESTESEISKEKKYSE